MSSDMDIKKNNIKEELSKLKYEYKVELPKIIAKARAFGDLKENAEYHAARERQSFVKARIAQYTEQLSNLSNFNVSDIPVDRVGFGSEVTVIELDSGDRTIFTIVSSDEVNPSEGKISLTSPIGIALRNKTAGDEIEINIPAGKRRYYLEKLITVHGEEFEKLR
jgi:transcription elongation factor GreA